MLREGEGGGEGERGGVIKIGGRGKGGDMVGGWK